MGRATLSLFAVICFIGVAQGRTMGFTCANSFAYKLIACPKLFGPTKTYCCEIVGRPRCCDRREFSRQVAKNNFPTPPPVFRHSSQDNNSTSTTDSHSTKLGIAAILGIIAVVILPFVLCCSCCYCACCPWYNTFHRNDKNVTVVQPAAYNPGNNAQNYFHGAQQNQSGMQQSFTSQHMQQAPPPYSEMEKTNYLLSSSVQ